MVAVGGKVGRMMGVGVGSGVVVGVITAVSVATGLRGDSSVGMAPSTTLSTGVGVRGLGVGAVVDSTTDLAHPFSNPKQSSSSKNGSVMRTTRLRFERRCGVVSGSSIAAAF